MLDAKAAQPTSDHARQAAVWDLNWERRRFALHVDSRPSWLSHDGSGLLFHTFISEGDSHTPMVGVAVFQAFGQPLDSS
jgi:hypothetical protein